MSAISPKSLGWLSPLGDIRETRSGRDSRVVLEGVRRPGDFGEIADNGVVLLGQYSFDIHPDFSFRADPHDHTGPDSD